VISFVCIYIPFKTDKKIEINGYLKVRVPWLEGRSLLRSMTTSWLDVVGAVWGPPMVVPELERNCTWW
jgi:hypothetical protein